MDSGVIGASRYSEQVNSTFNTTGLSSTSHKIVGAYLVFIGTLGVVGNTLVIISLVLYRRKRTIHETFLINLAVTDIGVSLTGYPWAAASSFAERWLFGDAGCQWYGFCGFFFGIASITTLGVISFQRYTTICCFHSKYHIQTQKSAFYFILGIWAYSLFWALMPIVGWSRYAPEPYETSCTVHWYGKDLADILLLVCMLVFIVGTNVLVFGVSYVAIVITIKKRGKINPWSNTMSDLSRRAEKRTTRISFTVVVAFLICWLPYAVLSLWSDDSGSSLPVEITVLPALLAKSSCFINPIIYMIGIKKYRALVISVIWRTDARTGGRNAVSPAVNQRGDAGLLTPISAHVRFRASTQGLGPTNNETFLPSQQLYSRPRTLTVENISNNIENANTSGQTAKQFQGTPN